MTFEAHGQDGVFIDLHDVDSDLRTKHRFYFTDCDCTTPEYALPK